MRGRGRQGRHRGATWNDYGILLTSGIDFHGVLGRTAKVVPLSRVPQYSPIWPSKCDQKASLNGIFGDPLGVQPRGYNPETLRILIVQAMALANLESFFIYPLCANVGVHISILRTSGYCGGRGRLLSCSGPCFRATNGVASARASRPLPWHMLTTKIGFVGDSDYEAETEIMGNLVEKIFR